MTTTAPKNRPNIGAIVIITVAVALNLVLAKLMATWSYSWFPPQASGGALRRRLVRVGNRHRILHLLWMHWSDGLGAAVQPRR